MKEIINESERVIGESEEELLLKKYLNRIYKIFGEDYSALILCSDYDIKKSISKFTTKLFKINNINAKFILLKSALLSRKEDYYTKLVKSEIEEERYNHLLILLDNDICFRKSLSRTFIKHSNYKNTELFKQKENKEEIYSNLAKLHDYERYIKVQDYLQNYQYKKVKKRGNR